MAEKEKKKKKGIVHRMMFGNEDKPDLTPEQLNITKWEMFKYLFGHRFGTLVMLNILNVLFAVPAILVIVLFYFNVTAASGMVPYSANFGIGYPVITDAVQRGMIAVFTYHMYECILLIPCIAIFALGLAGSFYVMRKLIWEEPVSTVKDFFRGIKKCWLPALIMGIIFGLTIFMFFFSIEYFDAYQMPKSLKVLSIVLSVVLLVFISMFTCFFMTQNAAFKMKPMVLIRNSVLFILGTNIQAIIFFGIALAPVFLWLIPGFTVIVCIIYFFLGFSFSTLIISLYCHYCYQKFLYNKIENMPKVYAKRPNEIEEQNEKDNAAKKKAPVPYKNPKKRKKSIDEGSSITPLAPTFRREDLERLQKEHEAVMQESDASPEQAEAKPQTEDDATPDVPEADGAEN